MAQVAPGRLGLLGKGPASPVLSAQFPIPPALGSVRLTVTSCGCVCFLTVAPPGSLAVMPLPMSVL